MSPSQWSWLRLRWRRFDGWLVFACVMVLLALAQLLDPRRPPVVDTVVLDWLGHHLNGGLGMALLQVYRLSGVGFTAVLVMVALIYLVLKRWWNDLALLSTSTAGILVIIDLWLKPLFDRARPHEKLLHLDGRSFPSGHAAGSITFYFAMVAILAAHHPRWRGPLTLAAGLWVALVWLSTLFARAHWPTDLLAGGAVGLAWLTVCLAIWRGQRQTPSPPQGRVTPGSPLPWMSSIAPLGLAQLRGLRSAPALSPDQRAELRAELTALVARCTWFTIGVMAPSASTAVQALRTTETALGWPPIATLEGDSADGDAAGTVFLKANQRTGTAQLRQEAGLGEGLLITGHNPEDPSHEDTWGPLPLDLFA